MSWKWKLAGNSKAAQCDQDKRGAQPSTTRETNPEPDKKEIENMSTRVVWTVVRRRDLLQGGEETHTLQRIIIKAYLQK